MIMGNVVGLRPYAPRDAEDLERLYSDLDTHLIASPVPHIPRSAEAIRHRLEKALDGEPDPNKDIFLTATGPGDGTSFLGVAIIWGIDAHNRLAHLGILLPPDARKRGYGSDIIKTLCGYCFRMRNLRRVELETNATNAAMRRTAVACGFTEEGRLRQRHYDGDGYVDVITFGLLRSEWLVASGSSVDGH